MCVLNKLCHRDDFLSNKKMNELNFILKDYQKDFFFISIARK